MGNVVVVSDTWDYIATVEISEGSNLDANQNPRKSYSDVPRDWQYVGQEGTRVCFRRSSDPQDPASPLNEWTCDEELLSGKTSTLSLT